MGMAVSKHYTCLALAGVLMALATPALALPVARDGEVIDSVGGGAIEPVLAVVESDNGVRYITGGVGDEELAALKAEEGNFNVHLLITSAKGEYMSELAVQIVDAKGVQRLNVEGAGPLFYTDLPSGSYTAIITSTKGLTKTAKFQVSPKTAKGKTHIRF